MPDLLDDGIPPEPFRAPQQAPVPREPAAPRAPTPPAPETALNRQRSSPKSKEQEVPELERARAHAVSLRKVQGEQRRVMSTDGVIGDLDEAGLDLLAGFIALINGVSFSATECHRHRNPGGFGITLWPPMNVPMFHILPRRGSSHAGAWLTPIFDALLQTTGKAKPSDLRQFVQPITFPSWRAGGDALLGYLRLISSRQIPYFYLGPMTPIAAVLACYDSPVRSPHTYAWSDLLAAIAPDECAVT